MSDSSDAALPFSQCEVTGFDVDYDFMIDAMDVREVIQIPTGSIRINGLGIGEAAQKEFSEATLQDPTDGTYWNGNETYSPDDNEYPLFIGYDENGMLSTFQYKLGS